MDQPLPPTPFQVLIVAKTHMGAAFCVGGIAQNGRSVRLQSNNNAQFEIGDVWQIDKCTVPKKMTQPHTEDVEVHQATWVRKSEKLLTAIEQCMPPICGGIEQLFEGTIKVGLSGYLWIAPDQVPTYSTLFWRPDRDLTLTSKAPGKFRYGYPADGGLVTLSYTGCANALDHIPAGTLVRVSLARWWSLDGNPVKHCYLQVSGWYDETPSAVIPPAQTTASATNKPVLPAPIEVDLPALLQNYFGYRDFRPYQQEIIETVLARRDVLVVMSTGAGKSLCYQLPALAFSGLTVVISPLISLMQDQVTHLTEYGIAAAAINSQIGWSAREQVEQHARAGLLRLLYVAPETLVQPRFRAFLQTCHVDCLVVDEAHCISKWGHDFRPEYRMIQTVRAELGHVQVIALTATATHQVRQDILDNLEAQDAISFVAPFDRPNLFLGVQPRQMGLQQVFDFLAAHPDQSGIIYCLTKKRVDELAGALQANGISALPYHAGLDTGLRTENQRRFVYDEVRIMVATVAFGMGIDKPDIRFVLHYELPSDIESYYQQIGRAGRDGDRADCLLLYGPKDFNTIKYFINQGDPELVPAALARLQHLNTWVLHTKCRRKWLIKYFGDTSLSDECEMCDSCRVASATGGAVVGFDDITSLVHLLLTCVLQAKEKFGSAHIIKVLRGSKSKTVLHWKHHLLSTYAQGKGYSRGIWQSVMAQVFQQKLLVQNDMGALKLTPQGNAVLQSGQVFGNLPTGKLQQSTAQPQIAGNSILFEQLRALRLELAHLRGLPAFMVFPDRTLREMAIQLPRTRAELAQVHGVGELKMEQYGDQFLATIRGFLQSDSSTSQSADDAGADADAKMPSLPRKPQGTVSERRARAIADLQAGRSLEDVAESWGVQPTTVLRYVYRYISEQGQWPEGIQLPAPQVSEVERAQILRLFAEAGAEALSPIYSAMESKIDYLDLDLLRLEYLQAKHVVAAL